MITMTRSGCFKVYGVIVILFLFCNALHAQNSWNEKAKIFVAYAAKNRYKFSIVEINSTIDTISAFINRFSGNSSRDIQSSLYQARANMRIYLLEYEADDSNDDYRPSAELISGIKTDFVKAQSFCPDCKCDMFDNIFGFYSSYGTEKQLDSLELEAKALGRPTDHTYVGADLNYTVQKNIAGIGFGIMNAWTVLQPKKWINAAGKKYRKCDYDYPMSVGLFFVGYETSFTDRQYNAVKIDPVWLNYMFSIHPLQIIYADWTAGKAFIYRPELGFSFSTFAINYALNVTLNQSFNFLPQNNISIRFCIPTIKVN